MSSRQHVFEKNTLYSMSEGVLAIDRSGVIRLVNPAAAAILQKSETELLGETFASCFFGEEENDDFNQAVLDAVYDVATVHENYVSYHCGDTCRELRMVTSFLIEDGEKQGTIVVLSDITELSELRDEVRAMQTIRSLNKKLEQRNEFLRKTFGRYLTDDIVEEILESPTGLTMGGTKRPVTILMSDLRGFTAMCERMEASDLIRMLNHYFESMHEVIDQHNGTILEFLGDGMLIAFGLPPKTEDHASRAVAAAVAMQDRMTAVNDWNRENGFMPLEMGIGVNTDEVIVGNIGAERATKYGVIGSGVNLASRIESYTTKGQVLISERTKKLVAAPLTVLNTLPVRLKGVGEEIEVYEVVAVGSPFDVSCPVERKNAETLPEPVRVLLHRLTGKEVRDEEGEATLTALSEDVLIIDDADGLKIYDNVYLPVAGGIYAKVLKTGAKEAELVITARPDGFEEWMKELLSGRKK